ncbi:MAG: hypothetical protein CM1200mP9_04420 [Gammaproteobacteria bacterium]|nr:MAG: hypothetical protein CM1200mP9_04420 [Gammaproteobacteria bacterium]
MEVVTLAIVALCMLIPSCIGPFPRHPSSLHLGDCRFGKGGGTVKGNLINVDPEPEKIEFGMPVDIVYDDAWAVKMGR